MNKLKTLVASVALAAGVPAMAAYHSTPAPMVPCKQHQLLPKLDRNQSDFFSQCEWNKRIKMSGYLKISGGKAVDVLGRGFNDAEHNLTFADDFKNDDHTNVESGDDLWLSRAVLNVDAVLNDWAEAHIAALYWNDNNIFNNADAMWYNRFHGKFQTQANGNGNKLPIDEANLVIGNFAQSPIFFRLGRQYLDFGWFDKAEQVASLPHMFSQGLHDAVQVGFVDVSGFSGSFSFFSTVDRGDNKNANVTGSQDRPEEGINNFVVSLGYALDNGTFSLDAKVDYLRDIFGVDYFDGYNGNGILGMTPAGQGNGGAWSRPNGIASGTGWMRPDNNTSMWAVTVKGKFGDFDGIGQYVGASEDLDKDIWTVGGDGTEANGQAGFSQNQIDGARPQAWLVGLGYSFPLLGRDSRVGFTYQASHDAQAGTVNDGATPNHINYYMPEKRFGVTFDHNLLKNVDLSLEYYRDKDYGTTHYQSAGNTTANNNSAFGGNFRQTGGTSNKNTLFLVNVTGRFN